ncbi:MAG: hypothetical protein WCA10_12075 [Terracidiphilus sp.]
MTGEVPPNIEKPVPVIETELMLAGAVPLEVTVTDFVTAVPSETLPNASELALRLSAGFVAFSCITKLFEEAFALADNVAVCDVLTEATFALNEAADVPEATDTAAGTVTELLLLATLTLRPADGAAEVKERVHTVVAAPVNELPAHESAPIEGVNGAAEPLRLIEVVFETFPSFAVSVTVCKAVTADVYAAKVELVAPEGTTTEAGTVTEPLLLARLTVSPPFGACALNDTVQVSVPATTMVVLAQLKPVRVAEDELEPFPCNFTQPATVSCLAVIAVTLSWPVESVADAGA